MKVLHITNMYPTIKKPWYGVFIYDQIKSLDKYVENEVLFIDGNTNKINYFKAINKIRKASKKYDIIHCHHGWCGLITLMAVGNSKKVCVSLVGGDLLEKNIFYKKQLAKVLWYFLPKFDFVIGKSEEMVEVCSGKTKKTKCVPNGVDMNLFKEMDKNVCKEKLSLNKEKKYFLFTAAKNDKIRVEKRYDIIEKAKDELASRGVRDVEILSLSNVNHDEVPVYLNACEGVLMSSDYEGSPNIIKESLACNVPIISTAVGNVPKMVEGLKNCYVIDQDPLEFANVMEKFVSSQHSNRCEGRKQLMNIKLDDVSIAKVIYDIYRGA